MEAVAVFDRDALCPGQRISGPALVDGSDTTVWIPSGATAELDDHATIVISVS
jgi:N-methylhydantoinase A/oxoprolinase/acetone carboxylase beta subunit